MLSAPAPYVTAATPIVEFTRAAASAAKPTAGSWLSVYSGRICDCSAIRKNGNAKSPGIPKISLAPCDLSALSSASDRFIHAA